jgi:hypothetical protein
LKPAADRPKRPQALRIFTESLHPLGALRKVAKRLKCTPMPRAHLPNRDGHDTLYS